MILAVIALVIGALAVASILPARTPPPTYIVLQAPEPPAATGSGGLPLLLLVGAVIAAIAFL